MVCHNEKKAQNYERWYRSLQEGTPPASGTGDAPPSLPGGNEGGGGELE